MLGACAFPLRRSSSTEENVDFHCYVSVSSSSLARGFLGIGMGLQASMHGAFAPHDHGTEALRLK